MNKLNYPTNFAVTASINPTDALFFAKKKGSDQIFPVLVEERTVLGTISNLSASKEFDKDGKIKKIENPNIQRVEYASLPKGTDTLVVKWNLKITPSSLNPYSCNEIEYKEAYQDFVGAFANANGYEKLAELYAEQILSGTWLWRNIDGISLQVKVNIKGEEREILNNDGQYENKDLLVAEIKKALNGEKRVSFIKVEAEVELDELVQVYPSQEFIDNNKDKKLFKKENNQAAMHSQKIGNKIRQIDNWYSENATKKLAVEPYGVDSNEFIAHRKDKNSLYAYLQELNKYTEEMINTGLKNHHLYIAACFIRGGVFGGK